MLISVNVIGISIMLGFYAFTSGARFTPEKTRRKKKETTEDEGWFQWNIHTLSYRRWHQENRDPVKEIDAKAWQNRGISLRSKESRHVAREETKRGKKEKENKSKTIRLVYSISRQEGRQWHSLRFIARSATSSCSELANSYPAEWVGVHPGTIDPGDCRARIGSQ